MTQSASSASVLVGPEVDVAASTASSDDDASYSAFQGTNTFRGASMTVGNFFLGLQGYAALRFRDLGIPRHSKIIAARLNLVPTANNGAAHTILVRAMTHQGRRATHWKRVAPVTAWQPDLWGTFNGLVRDSGGGTVADLSPSGDQVTATWALQVEDQHGRDEIAQQFSLSVPTEVADVSLELIRTGAPAGNVDIRIEGSKTVQSYNEPDGAVHAFGSTVAAALPLAAGTDTIIAMDGVRVLMPGVYHVIVSRAAYAVDPANFVSWTERRAFFNNPAAKHHARASGLGYGNYPGHSDIGSIDALPVEFSWNVATAVIGIPISAIGIEDVIQQVVDRPGYDDGDPIGIILHTNAQPSNRRFASFDHATFAAPELEITYRRRQRFGGGGLDEDEEDIIVVAASLLFGDC